MKPGNPVRSSINGGMVPIEPYGEGLQVPQGLPIDGATDESDHLQEELRGGVVLLVCVQMDTGITDRPSTGMDSP